MRWLSAALRFADRAAALGAMRRHRERPALLAFVFHNLFENDEEVKRGLADPFQPVLIDQVRCLVDYYLEHGYTFVSPARILEGLEPQRYYAFLTFDDGYASNLRVLPILRELRVPATFFVATDPIAEGRAFWWDVLYRERQRSGASESAIRSEQASLKRLSTSALRAYMDREFGDDSTSPLSEIDRPMTPRELRELASDPLVTLGNHTAGHAVLTVHDDDDVRAQISACQEYLRRVAAAEPVAIAYPNGTYDDRVARIARSLGLRLGVSTEPRKNRLPLSPRAEMSIARYSPTGQQPIAHECDLARSDLQLGHALRRSSAVR